MHTTLTSKGQVTIPKVVRDRLGLETGDRLWFRFQDDGKLVVEPERKSLLGRLPGLLRDFAPQRPVTVEQMREAVGRRARRQYRGKGSE